jgi:hypothetical protein
LVTGGVFAFGFRRQFHADPSGIGESIGERHMDDGMIIEIRY